MFGVVTDGGKVKLSDGSNIVVASDGAIKRVLEAAAATGYSIEDVALNYGHSAGLYAIPEGIMHIFSSARSSRATGARARAISTSGQYVLDFYPEGTTSTTTTALAKTGNIKSTIAHSYTKTTYYPSDNGTMTTRTHMDITTDTLACSFCPIVQTSVNGSKKAATDVAAGIAAVAAALLLQVLLIVSA